MRRAPGASKSVVSSGYKTSKWSTTALSSSLVVEQLEQSGTQSELELEERLIVKGAGKVGRVRYDAAMTPVSKSGTTKP